MELKKGKTVFLVGFLLILIIWMISFGGRIAELNRLTSEYDQAQETMVALTATTRALSTLGQHQMSLLKNGLMKTAAGSGRVIIASQWCQWKVPR